ncbi:MAG: hypothetical protein ABMA64_38475 [Myxococcota bacterium]
MEALAQRLVAAGSTRAAVVLVERWAEVAAPTSAARVAEARALLDLRMVDRAWLRLRELVECAEPVAEAVEVGIELFLVRGWPNQAKKLIQRGLERTPDDPALLALQVRASEPATTLDEDPADSDGLSVAELVRLSEQYMVRGAFLRARTLLERAKRRHPDNARVADLLWALAGDYSTPEPLEVLLLRLELAAGPDADDDEPEHTESARADDSRAPDPDLSFPKLFRAMVDPETSETGPFPLTPIPESPEPVTSEVTAITSLAELGMDPSGLWSTTERTDHGDDTQIARVMRRSGPVDTIHAAPTSLEPAFDLAAFRRDMGMLHAEGLEAAGEEEDDSVIVHTRDFEAGEGDDAAGAPLGSLLSDAANEQLAKSRTNADDEAWARPVPPMSALPPDDDEANVATEVRRPIPSGRDPDEDDDDAGYLRSYSPADTLMMAWPYWVAVFAAIFALFVLVFAVLSIAAALS